MTSGYAGSRESEPRPNAGSTFYAVATLNDLRNNPGARLHRLKGDRAGQWAIAINEQYRLVFDWNDGPATVEITDYH